MTTTVREETLSYGEQRSETQKAYDEKVLARVKAGIAFLEEHVGPGWVDRVDLRTLDLSHGARCVLGQVFDGDAHREGSDDGYTYATEEYEEVIRDGTRYGFYEPDGVPSKETYAPLQACWEDVLTPTAEKR